MRFTPPPPIPGDQTRQPYSVQPGGRGYLGRLELVGGFRRGEQGSGPSQDRLPPGRYQIVATARVGTMELRSAPVVFLVR